MPTRCACAAAWNAVIGFLHVGLPEPYARMVAAFLHGLSESGFVEGRNVAIEYRWADGNYDRLKPLVEDLVRLNVAVIAALTQDAALAAKTHRART